MSPEDEAQLRYLMRKKRELPLPLSEILSRTTRRFSSATQPGPSIKQQAQIGALEQQRIESQKKKEDALNVKQELQQQKKEQQLIKKSAQRYNKEKKSFQKDLEKENVKLKKLKDPRAIVKQAELIRVMNKNYEKRFE